MVRLLMELAVLECRIAALELAAGGIGKGARLLARASYFLRLRADGVLEPERRGYNETVSPTAAIRSTSA